MASHNALELPQGKSTLPHGNLKEGSSAVTFLGWCLGSTSGLVIHCCTDYYYRVALVLINNKEEMEKNRYTQTKTQMFCSRAE